MRISQSVDKWIVFAALLATALIDLAFSTLPGGRGLALAVIPAAFALIGMTVYVLWCALCRFVCRLIAAEARTRLIANGVAFLAFALMVSWPLLFPGQVITETFKTSR
jgi:hypothetical protein